MDNNWKTVPKTWNIEICPLKLYSQQQVNNLLSPTGTPEGKIPTDKYVITNNRGCIVTFRRRMRTYFCMSDVMSVADRCRAPISVAV